MKKYSILFGFLPWLIFFFAVGNFKTSIIQASIFAIISILILEYNYLKKLFILPLFSIIFFILLASNAYLNFVPIAYSLQPKIATGAIALIMWLSLLLQKPFTLQYAKEEVESKYWTSPLFKKVNWYLSFTWAILLTILAIIPFVLAHTIYNHSWLWNYGFSIILIFFGVYLNKNLPNFIISQDLSHTTKKSGCSSK